MTMQYIKDRYHVPAKRGMRVRVDGREGVIASASRGYINVRFNGAKRPQPCHPTWEVEYIGAMYEDVRNP